MTGDVPSKQTIQKPRMIKQADNSTEDSNQDKLGYISILFFVLYIVFLQADKNLSFDITPTLKIALSIVLTIVGIVVGCIGVRKNIQKRMSWVGIILNCLALISFSIGLIKGFL